MTSARSKGLQYVREVKAILEAEGYTVWGPGYRPSWFGGRQMAVHQDYFNLFDLLSMRHGMIEGHQVSTIVNKAKKIKLLKDAGAAGWVWCRTKIGREVVYRRWYVSLKGEL